MFFIASKIYWMIASPVILLLIVAFVATLYSAIRPSPAGRAVALGAILLLAGLAMTPIGLFMIAPLEDRFPQPPADMPPPDEIIVLGGAVRGMESAARDQTVFSEGERVVQAAILARRYPKARVIFTGGSGSMFAVLSTEAEEASKSSSSSSASIRRASRSRRLPATPTKTRALPRRWFTPGRISAGCSSRRPIICPGRWACSKRRGSA